MEIHLKIKKTSTSNINELFDRKNDAINFVDDYGSMILEAKRKAAEEEPKPEPSVAKTEHIKSALELYQEFINEIRNTEKNINEQRILFIIFHYF